MNSTASFTPVNFDRELAALSRNHIERTGLKAELQRWLAEDTTRSFIVLGQTGTGKSALAAQLVQTLPATVAFHFCVAGRRSTLAPRTYIRSIAAQLANKLDDYAQALANTIKPNQWIESTVSVAGDVKDSIVAGVIIEKLITAGPLDEFETLLQAPLSCVRDPGAPFAIVVDGLDEAATIGEPNIPTLLEYLEELPRWLRFVWTSQPDRRVMRHVDERNTRVRQLTPSDNKADLQRYIERRGFSDRPFVEAVLEKAGGNFQYTKVLLDAIDAGLASPDETPGLPKGLGAIYGRLLRRLSPDSWSGAVFGIASALAAAFEPLSEDQISRFSGVPVDEVRMHLGVFGQFLETSTNCDEKPTFTIFHQSLRNYLFDRETNSDFWISPTDAHGRISASYAGTSWQLCDSYGLRYLPSHLAHAGHSADLRNLLLDFGYLQSTLSATSITTLIGDYDFLPGDADLRIIREVISFSASIVEGHPEQLPSQLIGRLLPHCKRPAIRTFCDQVIQDAPRPWFRPLKSGLTPVREQIKWTLEGVSAAVTAFAITPDGRRIVSASTDTTLRVWDIETGDKLLTFRGHSSRVIGVVILPTGRVVSGSASDVKEWDINTGDEVRSLPGLTGRRLTAAPNGRYVVFSDSAGTLRVRDQESNSTLRTIKTSIRALAFTSDSRNLIVAPKDVTLEVWDVRSRRSPTILEGLQQPAFAVAAMKDGRHAISASYDCKLKIWDIERQLCVSTIERLRYNNCSLALFSDDRFALLGGDWPPFALEVWDIENRRCVQQMHGHSAKVWKIAVTPDDRYAVSASEDGTLRVWDLSRRRGVRLSEGKNRELPDIMSIKIANDGQSVVSMSWDHVLSVWDVKSGKCTRMARGKGTVSCFAVTQDGRRAVSAADDQHLDAPLDLTLWNLEDGTSQVLKGHKDIITAVAFAPDGRQLVSASRDYSIRAWAVGGTGSYLVDARPTGVVAISFTPDGRQVLIWFADRALELHDVSRRGCKRTRRIEDVAAIAADGTHAIAIRRNKFVVWDSRCGRFLATLEGQRSSFKDVAVTPDGKYVVGAVNDFLLDTPRRFVVWNLETGQSLGEFEGLWRSADVAAITADGRHVVSASHRTLKAWDIGSGDEVAACLLDYPPTHCVVLGGNTIVAGDSGGGIHILALDA